MKHPQYGPTNPEVTYVEHAYEEHLADLGEIDMNYVVSGSPDLPALLLIPGQTESWWGYEDSIPHLDKHFQVYAVDLRGQGRSTGTPGRYTLDNFGNDVVRFIALVIQQPTIVSGLSSGGVISAWLSAYAMPGQIRAACYEDPPLFSSQINPAVGQSIRQSIGPVFELLSRFLGGQWTVGDYEGMLASRERLPSHLQPLMALMLASGEGPPQNLKEYDPEWGRTFYTGTVAASCDHEQMLKTVKCPILFTHHFRRVDENGNLLGAISDVQAKYACELIAASGQPCEYRSFPAIGHSMHRQDPSLYASTLLEWAGTLDSGARRHRLLECPRGVQRSAQLAPPTGLEPVHPAPEAGALSTELRGRPTSS
jgi:pimeloyl-ACP methyl ester carboxylesterase